MSYSGKTPKFKNITLGDSNDPNAEIIVDNGEITKPSLKFNNTDKVWEYSNDGVSFKTIDTRESDATTTSKGVIKLSGDLSGTADSPTVPGLTTKAPIASPSFTGNPTAPTQTVGNNSTRLATTAFVNTAISTKANLESPTFTGTPLAPTPTAGLDNTQIATTAFVNTAIINNISPNLSGTPTATTPPEKDNSNRIATTEYVDRVTADTTTYTLSRNKTSELITTLDLEKSYDISYLISRVTSQTNTDNFNSNLTGVTKLEAGKNVFATAVDSSNKILVCGEFTDFNYSRHKSYLLRFNSDGSEDTDFSLNAVTNGSFAYFNSTIYNVAIQSDGKILVGGNFTNYKNQFGKSYLVRLNSDGTEDTSFSTNLLSKFNNYIYEISLQSDGKILVGGNFTNYGSQSGKSYLIRLNSDGTEDTSFSNNAVTSKINSLVTSLVVQSDGKILLGGNFTDYSSQTGLSRFLRLNSDGTLDSTFSNIASVNLGVENFNAVVNSIFIQSDGKILVGGNFNAYKLQDGKNKLIRLNSDGTEDTTFSNNALLIGGSTPKFNNEIFSINVQSNKILIGGSFTNYISSGISRLVRLNLDGTYDSTFNSLISSDKINNSVRNIYLDSTARLFVSGNFFHYSNDSYILNSLLIFENDNLSSLNFNLSFASNFSSFINYLTIQSDGKILVGGSFTNYKNQLGKSYLLRFNSNGTEDTSFSTNIVSKFNGKVNVIKLQSDGKILVGGDFTNYDSNPGNDRLIRLNSDGTEDTSFSTNVSVVNAEVKSIAVQSDGKIIIGGSFVNYAGVNRSRLIRLNSNGTEDTIFTTNAVTNIGSAFFNETINNINVQSDGKILVLGNFTRYKSTDGKNYLIRLNSDGTEDTTFSNNAVVSVNLANFNAPLRDSLIQSDDKIVLCGDFTDFRFQNKKNYIIRLNSNGTEDTSFSSNAVISGGNNKFNALIRSVSIQSDGKILVGGDFTSYNNVTDNDFIVRLNTDGTEDLTFKNVTFLKTDVSSDPGRVNFVLVDGDSYYILARQSKYRTFPFNSIFKLSEKSIQQKGILQATPELFTGMYYSSVISVESSLVGISLIFELDGSIKYTSDSQIFDSDILKLKLSVI
jgi:uncharacterized delta-60 repeat protein